VPRGASAPTVVVAAFFAAVAFVTAGLVAALTPTTVARASLEHAVHGALHRALHGALETLGHPAHDEVDETSLGEAVTARGAVTVAAVVVAMVVVHGRSECQRSSRSATAHGAQVAGQPARLMG